MKKGTTPKRTYTIVACNEDGEHLAEVQHANWIDLSSFIATWTRQFELGMDLDPRGPTGLRWDRNGYIQIHPEFN